MTKVVFITDDGYVDYTLISMKSVIAHTRAPLEVVVVYDGHSDDVKRKLAIDDCVTVLECDGTRSSGLPGRRHISRSMYIKFDLPNIIGDDACLYLDGDTIVVGDISELLVTDVGDNAAMVVKDFGEAYTFKPRFGTQGNTFNCGVMLMNLAWMRKNDMTRILYDARYAMTCGDLSDQEVYNKLLEGKVGFLPVRFNLSMDKITNEKSATYKDVSRFNTLYGTEYKSIDELLSDGVIYHFHGDKKNHIQ